MALTKGEVHYLFRGGIERKSDDKTVSPAQLLALENGVFRKAGTIGKRNGYEALSTAIDGSATALSGLIRLASRDDELIGFTSDHSYSHQADTDLWGDVGSVYSVVGADRPLARTGTEQTMPDHATNEGVMVAAWEDSRGGVWYTVTDATSGRIHIAPTQADANGRSPRCVPVGGLLHIYYANAVLGRIYVIVVNPATPSATVTPDILVDDLDTTNPHYDACPTTRTGTPAAIAWHEAATTNIRIGYVDAGGVLGSALSGHPSVLRVSASITAASPIAVASGPDAGLNGGSALFLAYVTATLGRHHTFSGGDASTAIGAEFDSAVTAYAAPTNVTRIALASCVVSDVVSKTWVAFEETAVAASNRFVVINSVAYTGSAGTERTQRSVGLASRAWSFDESTEAFAYFVHDTTYFNVYLALRLSDSICVARSLPGQAGDAPARKHLASAHVDGDIVSVSLPYNERLRSENGDEFGETAIRLLTLDYSSEDSHQHAQLGRGLYLAGACPQHYDGRKWTEQGFHVGPELIATVNGSSGSLTQTSTYLYRVWYEWPDAQGEVHRGPVSFGTTVTLTGGEDEVTLTLPTLRVTQKPNVRICVARSRAAQTGATAELFRVTSLDATTVGTANGYVANSTSSDTVSFNDRMSDTVLATQEPLYTNGGILSTDPSALGHVVVEGKGRLFFTDPSDPNIVRYSQKLETGYGVECPPELFVPCSPFGGAVTGLATQDGEVIVFKEHAIMAFNGDGPTPSGDTATQGFSDPRLITSDVGCTDPASIVLTPMGHAFKSAKGIYLIDRSGSTSYVGAPAEAYNSQTTVAATVMPDRTQIVFLTDDGTTLLYDFLFQQWSTFTNHLGRDAHVVSNRYHYLRLDGRVFRETVGEYSDAGQRITLRLETAWLHAAAQLQGMQRFWNVLILGGWLSPHQFAISHRVDYSPGQAPASDASGWNEPWYLDATGETTSTGWLTGDHADPIGDDSILGSAYGEGAYGDGDYGGSAPDIYQWRYAIDERGQAIQLRFEDFERTGLAGASFELTEMVIECGVAGTSYKPISAARSA